MEVSGRQLRQWRRQGLSVETIAIRCNVSPDTVREWIADTWRGCQKRGTTFVEWNEVTIRLRASAIRQHWSPEVEASRRVTGPAYWIPPGAPRVPDED